MSSPNTFGIGISVAVTEQDMSVRTWPRPTGVNTAREILRGEVPTHEHPERILLSCKYIAFKPNEETLRLYGGSTATHCPPCDCGLVVRIY